MTSRRLPIHVEPAASLEVRIAEALSKLGLAMKQQTWQQANDEGLSATQGQILAALVGTGPLTASELRDRLGVTLPTISDSVRVLVDKGLVARSPDPRHARASLLTPTSKGAKAGARARSWPEFMADAATELEPDEQRALLRGTLKMIRKLEEQGLIPLSGMCVTCTNFRPNVHGGAAPHHCALLDAPLAGEQLRLDCAEHERAPDDARRAIWEAFVRTN